MVFAVLPQLSEGRYNLQRFSNRLTLEELGVTLRSTAIDWVFLKPDA
jgi:hypothetical protein